ncbi:MAG: DUF4405 domain-containing protein [Rhodoblastus sp.]|nr:DUF4405 domain-containing protein [Rhodoblastus sp.]
MRISREWATPLTIGVFGLMAVTGGLMFFHLDTRLNKLAHEWLGWAMIAFAIFHVMANWLAFKRYFMSSNLARGLVGSFAVVLALSFVTPQGAQKQGSPPTLAMRAVMKAPLATLAPVSGKPVEQLLADLAKAGIVLPDAQATLDSVVKGDRGQEGKAMRAVFGRG